ncbi:helix-turn-helix transcriptional regulator [Streptomyces sp. NPDC052179]|uniref:helix-turn-helix transcriptional regulator n=1 Tax=Streptomyces sp. NPDC052179 TaxID=3155680 RepID=UPI0034128157
MATAQDRQRVILGEISDLCAARPAASELFRSLAGLLHDELGFEAGCFHGSDPVSGFPTSTLPYGLDPADFQEAAQLEFSSADSTTFDAIRASGRSVQSLLRATEELPELSVRYRQMLEPRSYVDELRVTFDSHGGRWGCAAFMRGRRHGPFTTDDIRLMERAGPHISAALRHSQLSLEAPSEAGPTDGEAASPVGAVVIVGADGSLVSADERAEVLLAEQSRDELLIRGIPSGLAALAEYARESAEAQRKPDCRTSIRTRQGQWLTLQASVLRGAAPGQVAIVAMPSSPAQRLPVELMAYGLTPREQDVALGALRGHSTRLIAERLSLSPLTVQDHLKSIFDRTGVRSRRDLVALLMADGTRTAHLPPC